MFNQSSFYFILFDMCDSFTGNAFFEVEKSVVMSGNVSSTKVAL